MTNALRPVRGIRQSIPPGTVLGRTAPGVGPAHPISISDLTTAVIRTGGVVTTGGSNPQGWQAGTVTTLAGALVLSGGTLSAPAQLWQAGTVTTVGTNLALASGTLSATVPPQLWQAGTVTTVGTNLALASGTLSAIVQPQLWQAGTVTAVGANLVLSSGTLSASAQAEYLPLMNGATTPSGVMVDPNGQVITVRIN